MPKSSSLKRPKNSSESDTIYKDEFERLQRQNDQLRQALKEKEYEVKEKCQNWTKKSGSGTGRNSIGTTDRAGARLLRGCS